MLREDEHSQSVVLPCLTQDIWKNLIFMKVAPLEQAKLTFVSKQFKTYWKEMINCELRVAFIFSCSKCGSRDASHNCLLNAQCKLWSYEIKDDTYIMAERKKVFSVTFPESTTTIFRIHGSLIPDYSQNVTRLCNSASTTSLFRLCDSTTSEEESSEITCSFDVYQNENNFAKCNTIRSVVFYWFTPTSIITKEMSLLEEILKSYATKMI
jgi:hypothetical protein